MTKSKHDSTIITIFLQLSIIGSSDDDGNLFTGRVFFFPLWYVSLHFLLLCLNINVSFSYSRVELGADDSPSSLMFKMANNCAVNSFQDNRHVNQ